MPLEIKSENIGYINDVNMVSSSAVVLKSALMDIKNIKDIKDTYSLLDQLDRENDLIIYILLNLT